MIVGLAKPSRSPGIIASVAVIVAASLLAMSATARAPAHAQPSGYAFTAAQVASGKAIYAESCAGCHGEGMGGPVLSGPAFAMRWLRGDRTLGDLDHAIRAMPKQAPGSLPAWQYQSLLAYTLSENGFAPGKAPNRGDPAMRLVAPTGASHQPTRAAPALPAAPKSVAPTSSHAVSDADLLHPADGDWPMFNRTYAGDRWSPLAQITPANASKLQPVCILSLGVLGSFQGAPLIYQGTGYIGSTYGVWAFDAATCAQKWSYTYKPQGPEGIPTSRGLALYDGKIFRGTPDGHLLAIDMQTGKLLWDAHVADGAESYSIGAAPIVFDGRVYVGLAGGDYGNTGHVYAFDAKTGARVWTFDAIDKKTWPKGAETGGGGTWTSVAVDPDKKLVFVPIGNPAPDYYLPARPGDNLYTNSVVALDATTGKVAWYVQQLAQDYHDWDTSAAPMLYEQDGKHYMAVGTKEGYLFIYDRDTHALISKSEVVPRLNADLPFSDKPLRVCPGTASGVEWNGPTYDPRNKAVFVNSVHWCATWTAKKPEGKKPGSWYVEAALTMDPMDQLRGYTHSFDAATGKKIWAREAPLPMIGGITATAGGVVLTGGADGMFLALDPRDGKELYRFNTGGGIGGGVSTYAVAGRQYVAVAAGGYGLSPFGMTGSPAVLVFALPQGK